MVKAIIRDGLGRKRQAAVTSRNALSVAECCPDVPRIGTLNCYRFYSALLGSTGADSGTTSQNVDGSVTPQEFYISSHSDYDIHIMAVIIVIVDNIVFHNRFGNVPALATGWDLLFTESGDATFLIEKAQTGGHVIVRAGLCSPYGDAATTFELSDYTAGNDDATTAIFPACNYVPGGLRIGRGTKDKISSVVNDDLTGLVDFTVRVLGYGHYPM